MGCTWFADDMLVAQLLLGPAGGVASTRADLRRTSGSGFASTRSAASPNVPTSSAKGVHPRTQAPNLGNGELSAERHAIAARGRIFYDFGKDVGPRRVSGHDDELIAAAVEETRSRPSAALVVLSQPEPDQKSGLDLFRPISLPTARKSTATHQRAPAK
jgi:hypothetical protein